VLEHCSAGYSMHWFSVNNIHNISVKGEGAASNYAVDEYNPHQEFL